MSNKSVKENAVAKMRAILHTWWPPTSIAINPDTCKVANESNAPFDLSYLSARNLYTIKDLLVEVIEGGLVNDRTYIMERVIALAAELPIDSTAGLGLTNRFLTHLWNGLQHPPLSILAPEMRYRSVDGSNNNALHPRLGAAGNPYARTVRPRTIQPTALPDPGVVFDSVMARRTFKPHPNKISSVLFYLASIIIHDLFRTNRRDPNNTNASSYLDLAPLYGSSQRDQDLIRTFRDGKIKPDTFSDARIHGFPPGVGVLLIMFNRFHNYTVEQLALIKENGRFTKPADCSKKDQYAKYDNDLFQTGRLVTCGLYINIILKDYVRTILNLNRTKSLWSLDPRSENPKNLFNEGATEAVGNQVSAEFNLVYRWHSCISLRDQKWSEDLFAQMFPDKDSTKVDVEEFIHAMRQWEESLPQYPSERSFARLQRTSEGKYNDDDLAAIFTESVEDCAGAFGANQVPIVLRAVEIMGIQQARSWNLASLNEFRRHFNLAPHKTFEDINPDPLVAEKLKVLYDHPDFVELYPGLVIEEAKEAFTPGSGLCANFTITRAILSDAVALVRGDRFYTIDYTPKQLTNWGFSLVDYDLSVDYGCVFHKLVLHALPHNYRQDSIYAHYPLVTPSENHGILTELGLAEDYSFSKPASIPKFVSISSYVACKSTLENKVDFRSISDEAVASLRRDGGLCTPEGLDFMQPGGGLGSGNSRRLMEAALYTAHWKQETKNFYEHITLTLLHRNTHTIAGVNQVDMVRDVLNPAQVHFASSVFSLPLKTDDNPHGLFTENELYPLMVIIFTSIFYDVDPARSFPLKHAARKVMRRLGELKGSTACGPAKTSLLSNLLEMFFYRSTVSNYGIRMIRRLLGSGTDPEKLDWTHFLTAAAAMVANHSQLSSQCLDFYLSDEGRLHLPEIKRLAKENTAEADDILLRYFMEGSRIGSAVTLPREAARTMEIQDGATRVQVEAGQQILCKLAEASMDPTVFPQPHEVDLNRNLDLYIHCGMGLHQCLGYGITKVTMTSMLRIIGQLDNLRRAPGPQGELKKIVGPNGFTQYMTADESSYSPLPTSMKVHWDGNLPLVKV